MNVTRHTPHSQSNQPRIPDTRRAEAALFLMLVALLGTLLIESAGGPRTMLRMSAGIWSATSSPMVSTASRCLPRPKVGMPPSLVRRLSRVLSNCRA